MVQACGFESLDAMIAATVPKSIVRTDGMDLGRYHEGYTENEFLQMFKWVAADLAFARVVLSITACVWAWGATTRAAPSAGSCRCSSGWLLNLYA